MEGDDDFPDGVILHIETNDPVHHRVQPEDKWLTEMSEFLSTGLPPSRMRTDEKISSMKLKLLYDIGRMAQMHPERRKGDNTTGSTLRNHKRTLRRRREGTKGIASKPLVADHPMGRPTVLSRVRSVPKIRPAHKTGTHVTPAGATLGTIP